MMEKIKELCVEVLFYLLFSGIILGGLYLIIVVANHLEKLVNLALIVIFFLVPLIFASHMQELDNKKRNKSK